MTITQEKKISSFTGQFILFETHAYCVSKINDIKRWLCSFPIGEIVTELQFLASSSQLVNFPILAAMLMEDEEQGLQIVDSFCTKAEHLLAFSYFMNHVDMNNDKRELFEDLLQYKCSSISSLGIIKSNELVDTTFATNVVKTIDDTLSKLNTRYRNNMSNNSIAQWKSRSIFVNMDEDSIIEKLNAMSFNELLSCINDALASGISKDMAIAFLGNSVSQGAAIAASKIFTCGLENIHLCELDTKKWNDYDSIVSSQYSITTYLSDIVKERYKTQEKYKERVIIAIDESGSQNSTLYKSELPIYKDQWSGMIVWEMSQIMTDIRIILTGVPSEIRENVTLNDALRKMDMFEFSLMVQDFMEHDDGIYEWETYKFIKNEFSLTQKDTIIILADSGDGDAYSMKRHKDKVQAILCKKMFINVEREINQFGSSKDPFEGMYCSETEVHDLKIACLSSYLMEPILRVLGINCSSAKNMDKSSISMRTIY